MIGMGSDYESYRAMVDRGGDANTKGLVVKFRKEPVQDPVATEKEGRPIFREEDFITIIVVGDKNNVADRPVTAEDKKRFARVYEEWKATNRTVVEGTPLKLWPAITAPQVRELEYFNVFTVEQLAELSDSNAQKFVGIQDLRRRAQDFVEQAKGAAPLVKMRNELDKAHAEIEALKSQVKQLVEKMPKK